MKIGIIGASGHAVFVLQGLRSLPPGTASLVGLAPGSEGESVQAFAAACRAEGWNPEVYADYRRMLDQKRPGVVAVNPFFFDHERITLELLGRGVHAFVEKPLALTLEGLSRVREAYGSSGAHLGCMLNMRYEPAVRAAFEAVRAGEVGEVRLVHAQKSYRLGRRPEFFKHRATFGGLIPWVGSHAIDLIACMSGERFLSVCASHSRRGNLDHGDLEVSAACLFRLGNEVVATAAIDYLRPESAPSHEDDRVRVAGTGGVLEVSGGRTALINHQGVFELPPVRSTTLFGDFVQELLGAGKCLVTAEEAFLNTEAALLARQSADTGESVAFPPQPAQGRRC